MMRPERIKPTDIVKMRSTIKSFVREWSAEGASERADSFQVIIDEVQEYFKEINR